MQALAEIRALLARHAPPSRMAEVMPGVWVRASTVETEPLAAIYEPAFALVAQGRKRTVLGGQVFEYGAGEFLVVSVDLPIVGQVVRASTKEPYLAVALTLKPATIAELLLQATVAGSSDEKPTGLAVSVASADLLDPIARLLRMLDRKSDVAVLKPLLEREVLWRLLESEQGATLRAIGLADSRLSHVSRAIRWIRAHFAEPLQMEDLAEVASMATSTFYRHFRAVTSMSPLQFQKQLRLHEARSRLIAGEHDIAGVGFVVGYGSPSQFSREYGRMFGAPPGKDAERLRALTTGARNFA